MSEKEIRTIERGAAVYEVEEIDPNELHWRIIYSLYLPAVRLASLFGLPLKEMKEWLGVAYLHELKRRGLSQKESALHIDVSRRTIIELTRKLRENFFAPERHEGVSRKILFLLWAEPMTLGRIKQAFSEEDGEALSEIEGVLEEMCEDGVLECEERQGVMEYGLKTGAFRLYRDNWIARIDALNNQLEHLADTIFARFLKRDESSFVRTVTLTMRKTDQAKLEALYREVLFPALVELDEAARGASKEEVQNMELNISWAPKDFILDRTDLREGEDG